MNSSLLRRFTRHSVVPVVLLSGLLAVLGLLGSESGGTVASAAAPAQHIGMRILLITDGTDTNFSDPTCIANPAVCNAGIAYQDWANTLQREGVPYTTMVTNSASPGSVPLPALSSTLPNGTQVANYQGVIVAVSGTLGLTDAQWTRLQTFEHDFSVRQVTAYAVPSSDYGLGSASPAGGSQLPLSTSLTLTASGAKVFPYLKHVAVDPTQSTWAYQATPLQGANVTTLVAGPGSSSLLGVYTAPDGRETMFQTFNQSQYYLQSELLRHGELDWLARNTYFGDQRNYLETHVDDNFLADDTWSIAGNPSTAPHSTDFNPADALREVPADIVTAANWSRANNFRIDMLFNGGGSVACAAGCTVASGGDTGTGGTNTGCNPSAPGTDPLLAQFQAADPATGKSYANDFGWVSHTWDHPNIDQGCAPQNYIEAELNQNTIWGSTPGSTPGNPNIGGLGLSATADPAAALGAENPTAIVTGEHSGLANLRPGNPGQVDPPALDEATPATTGGTLAAGQYVYAVSDQFNIAPPGAAPVAGAGQSAASVSAPVTVSGTTSSVSLSWGAVCHAADYLIYRAPYTGTIGAWSLIGKVTANTVTDFTNPTGNSTTNTSGGGAVAKTFPDTGIAGTLTGSSGSPTATSVPADQGTAVESPYEQNPVLDAAFAGTLSGGIKYFGSDASKAYPNPADGAFATGAYGGAGYPAGATFPDAGGTAIPRYPTNIYYNVATNAQEVDEYQTLYDLPTCVPIGGVTTCNPAGTPFTIAQIIASIDQGMFQHMMGNDPRPHYFHQTNLMSQPGQGDGLFYETINPLLSEYNTYFAGNAPLQQPTMAQIGTLLNEQAGWAAANASQISGFIQGSTVTVQNNGPATEIPLTGTSVGTPYAGTQSGWTLAPSGTSTYGVLAAWPAPPTGPVIPTPPNGSAPGNPAGRLAYIAIQAAPKTVSIKKGQVTVSLRCVATRGKTKKGKVCAGTFTLKVAGRAIRHNFRFKSGKIDRIAVKLPKRVMARVASLNRRHRKVVAALAISTKQPRRAKGVTTYGKLTIRELTKRPRSHAK
jgi:hypothetical protein